MVDSPVFPLEVGVTVRSAIPLASLPDSEVAGVLLSQLCGCLVLPGSCVGFCVLSVSFMSDTRFVVYLSVFLPVAGASEMCVVV